MTVGYHQGISKLQLMFSDYASIDEPFRVVATSITLEDKRVLFESGKSRIDYGDDHFKLDHASHAAGL